MSMIFPFSCQWILSFDKNENHKDFFLIYHAYIFFISADNKMKFQFKHIKQERKSTFKAANCTTVHAVMHSVLNATFAANCIEIFFTSKIMGTMRKKM